MALDVVLSNKNPGVQDSHFSFGNDESCLKSTYCLDFGNELPANLRKPQEPPNPAEIIPPHRDIIWASSNQQDFFSFSSINKDIHDRAKKDYYEIKVFSTRGNVCNSLEKLPPISRTSVDYGEPNAPCINVTFDLLRKIQVINRDTRIYNLPQPVKTEAMQAFQWPHAHRIKPVPMFQYSKERKRLNAMSTEALVNVQP